MTLKTVITVAVGDTTPLSDVISYPADTDIDLTDATVAFSMETAAGVAKIDGTACNVDIDTDAKTIAWSVPIGEDDFDTAGLYYPFLVVTYDDGVIETVRLWEDYAIKVVERGLT